MRALVLGLCALMVVAFVACDGGRDQLLVDINSVRPEVRAMAVKKLGKHNRAEDLVLFTRAAKDVSFLVRLEAVQALGQSQDMRVVDLLGELLEDPEESVQERAALALAEIKSDRAKQYLTQQYGHRGRSTRIAIVEALKAAKVPNAFSTVVAAEAKELWERNLQALSEGALAERVGAAEELGKSGKPEAVKRLSSLLKDNQVMLAAGAARGLGLAGDKSEHAPLRALLSENSPELREAAIRALGRLQMLPSIPPLAGAATENNPQSMLALEAILGFPRSPQTDEALCTLTTSAGEQVALEAGLAMRRRGGCPIELLGKLLDRASQKNRRAPSDRGGGDTLALGLNAVRGLGPTAKAALPWVLPVLNEKDAKLRRLAVQALGEIGDPSAAGAVEKELKAKEEALQPLHAEWIGAPLPHDYAPGFEPAGGGKGAALIQRSQALAQARLRDANKLAEEVHAGVELADDIPAEQVESFAASVLALGQLHAPGALSTLKAQSGDPSALVRGAALAGLAYLGSEGQGLAKAGLLDADRDVQATVARALAEQGQGGVARVLDVLPHLQRDRVRLLEILRDAPLPPTASKPLQQLVVEGGAEATLAAEMLGAMRATDSVETLIKTLDEPTTPARRAILLALGRIGDPKAADVAMKDLYSDSPDVRAAAAESLASLGTGAYIQPLDALRGDYYLRVRASAEAALAQLSTRKEANR